VKGWLEVLVGNAVLM